MRKGEEAGAPERVHNVVNFDMFRHTHGLRAVQLAQSQTTVTRTMVRVQMGWKGRPHHTCPLVRV